MQKLSLPRGVDLAVCALDSLDYITEPRECAEAIRRVYKALNPGGIFIFDVNTDYKYREVIGDSTIAENREDSSFIWENSFDPETGMNVYELTLFLLREDGLYEKEEENVLTTVKNCI